MAIHWVDASGGSPGGYTNFNNLKGGVSFQDGDIIDVVDNGEIDDSSISKFTVSVDITIRSWSGNTNRPTIKLPNGMGFVNFAKTNGNLLFQNLKMYKPGPTAGGTFININTTTGATFEISGCEFLVVDPTSVDNSCIGIYTNVDYFTVSCTIERNRFKGVYSAVTMGNFP